MMNSAAHVNYIDMISQKIYCLYRATKQMQMYYLPPYTLYV